MANDMWSDDIEYFVEEIHVCLQECGELFGVAQQPGITKLLKQRVENNIGSPHLEEVLHPDLWKVLSTLMTAASVLPNHHHTLHFIKKTTKCSKTTCASVFFFKIRNLSQI